MREELPSEFGAMRQRAADAVRIAGRNRSTFSPNDIAALLPRERGMRAAVDAVLHDFLAEKVIEKARGADARRLGHYRLLTDPVDIELDAQPTIHLISMQLEVPRTYDGLWAIMRELTKRRKGFTIQELRNLVGKEVADDVLTAYIRALERQGSITAAFTIASITMYRADLALIETPRPRSDGHGLIAHRRRANMWRSMKMLTYFTEADLASSASLPDLPVTVEHARRYIIALADAGYLNARHSAGAPAIYRLKNAMNTGPRPPEVLRAEIVWDPNTCRVANASARAEEVRP